MRKHFNFAVISVILIALILGSVYYMGPYNTEVPEKPVSQKAITQNNKKDPGPEEVQDVESEPIEEPDDIEITVTAVGDIMFHMPQIRAAKTEHGYNFYPSFSNIKYINERADLSLCNFETVTAGEGVEYHGFPRFNSPDSSVLALEATGFDVLVTANNHCLDQGKDGIINTIINIKNHNLDNVGTYVDQKSYLIRDVKGIKVGLLAYTYGLNGMDGMLSDEDRSNMIDLIDEDLIKRDIETIKKDSDIVLVYLHWGVEYQTAPNQHQIDLGEKIHQWGADAVLGSHPHVIQRAEFVDDKYIIYSMGNFISNQRWDYLGTPDTEDGVIVELNITKSGDETKIVGLNHIPTWTYMYRDDTGLNYTVLPIENGQIPEDWNHVPEGIHQRIQKSYNDTMDILEHRR